MIDPNSVTGVILAGGLARRMQNQDKGLVHYNGQPLISYAIKAMKPLVKHIIINANRNECLYQSFGFPVIADQSHRFDGPLAGILTAMRTATTELLLVMPCDAPLTSTEQLAGLLNELASSEADIAVPFDGIRLQPVFLALNTKLDNQLEIYLNKGERKVEQWLLEQNHVLVNVSQDSSMFVNINTWSELSKLETQP